MAQIQVRDEHGNGIPRINIRISEGQKPSDEAIFDVFTDLAGNTGWPIPFWPNGTYTLWVNYANVLPEFGNTNVTISHQDNVELVLPSIPGILSRVIVSGHDFINASGRWFMKGCTDFLLYKKYLDGEDIRPLLKERADLGVNCVRVIGMVSSFSHWYPQEYGDRYYDELPAFFRLLESYGLYCYFTVFADTQVVMPDINDQLRHFDRVVAKMRECENTIGELVNEPYAHDNATDNPHLFNAPYGVAFSGGSYNDQLGNQLRPVPKWESFHDFHTPRDGHKPGGFKYCADQVMAAHPEYKYRGKAVLSGEPQKFADPGDPTKGGSTLSDPTQARMMAGSARGTACGIVFHTPAGVFSRPFNGVERACAEAWFAELA